MTEQSFEIVPSGEIQQLIRANQLVLEPDMLALQALAERLNTRITSTGPVRILLLNQGLEALLQGMMSTQDSPRSLPKIESENDIVVPLIEKNDVSEPTLTASVAHVLLTDKWTKQNERLLRIGAGITCAGALTSLALSRPHPGVSEAILATTAPIGIGMVAYSRFRHEPTVPDITGFAPPIKVSSPKSGATGV